MDETTGEQDTLKPEGEEQDALIPEADLDAELAKADELEKNYQVRLKKAEANKLKAQAEKAEQEARNLRTPAEKPTPKNEDDSLKDLLNLKALTDVHDDDVAEVMKWAKFNNVSVAEAKRSPVMQSYLKNREEERKSAEVTNTGGGRRAVSRNTDSEILARAYKGELPERDDDIMKLSEARMNAKLKEKGIQG